MGAAQCSETCNKCDKIGDGNEVFPDSAITLHECNTFSGPNPQAGPNRNSGGPKEERAASFVRPMHFDSRLQPSTTALLLDAKRGSVEGFVEDDAVTRRPD